MGIDIKGLYRVWVIGQFGTLKVRDLPPPSAVSICEFCSSLVHCKLHVCCRVSQLFGRCGRDGKASEATLFVASDGQAIKCDAPMKTYCAAGSCVCFMRDTLCLVCRLRKS